MTIMRESWTDERLDDLNEKVDRGFREVKVEMNSRFDKIDQRFDKADARWDQRFDKAGARFDKADAEWNSRIERSDAKWDARFEALDEKWDARFQRLDKRYERLEDKIEVGVTDRIDSLNRTLLGFAVAVIFLLLTSKIPF